MAKINEATRHQILNMFKEGLSTPTIMRSAGVSKVTVVHFRECYKKGDLGWLSDTRNRFTEEFAQQAVRLYLQLQSYSAVGRILGILPSSVWRFVRNFEAYGQAILPNGRPPKNRAMRKNKSQSSKFSLKPAVRRSRSSDISSDEWKIMFEALLDTLEHDVLNDSSKKKLKPSFALLRRHIKEGLPLPNVAALAISPGASTTTTVEALANACEQIRLSQLELKLSKMNTDGSLESDA